MNKHISFTSGSEYFLRDLFGGDTRIIIPDLQRDYCWGDKAMVPRENKPRELVSGFVKSLLEQYSKSRDDVQTMGLIYGYEQPRHYLQICDGQQRLTTLFLLLGYINMNTPDCVFSDYIISSRERQDDYEPHLQYSIRESTLYFLSDLAKNVFINRTTRLADIRNGSEWYFNEYDQDASIQSMLAALDRIDEVFKQNGDIDIEDFGNYILDKLMLLYYDMGTRSVGEETYVVINTTGEPLSATENIKPVILGNLAEKDLRKFSDQWECREEWFWARRGGDSTADDGLRQFFQWYWQIGLIQEKTKKNGKDYPLNTRELFVSPPKMKNLSSDQESPSLERWETFRSLDNLNKYFVALKTLVSEIASDEKIKALLLSISSVKRADRRPSTLLNETEIWQWLRGAELHNVLPMITLIAEHPESNLLYLLVRRLRRNHFDLEWSKEGDKTTRRAGRFVDWRYIIQIITNSSAESILTADPLVLVKKRIPGIDNIGSWYGDNEIITDILSQNGREEEIFSWEDNRYMMGDLTPIWNIIGKEKAEYNNVKPVWDRFISICRPFLEKGNPARQDWSLFNWVRLYLVVVGMRAFDHIPNMTWTLEGIYYSEPFRQSYWTENANIRLLLASSDMIETMKCVIRNMVGEYIWNPSTHIMLATSWLAIKTLQAENSGKLVSTYTDRALGVYKKIEWNYIVPLEGNFNWGNIMLGFAWSYGVVPAKMKCYWEDTCNLDSPLYPLAFIPNFFHVERNTVNMDDISRGENDIRRTIKGFFGDSSKNEIQTEKQ